MGGELCYRGRHIMMGYMAQPDLGADHVAEMEKKTAETIDKDGWLHSGDKGMIIEAGMCKITGRYKELIIGSGGENIAPIPIEDHIKKSCDGIAECMMIGDKRKYNIALITLKAVGANGEVPGSDEFDLPAKANFPGVTTISAALDSKEVENIITAALKETNSNGKLVPNNSFKIQKYCILPTNFSEQEGELTPAKKLKRGAVDKRYQKLIDYVYTTDAAQVYVRFKDL